MIKVDKPAAVVAKFATDGSIQVMEFSWELGPVDVTSTGRTELGDIGRKVNVMDVKGSIYVLLQRRSDLTWRVLMAPAVDAPV